jgi:hypothetical protein
MFVGIAFAQYNEQVTVIAPYQPVLTDVASKLNPTPRTIDTVFEKKSLSYNIFSRQVPTSFDIETIKPAKISGEPLQKLYPFKAKIGMGNYWTALAEIYAGNLRSEKFHYGGYLRHLSSWGELKIHNPLVDLMPGSTGISYNHSNMTNEMNLFGGYFTEKIRMNLDLLFQNELYHLPNNVLRPRILGNSSDRGRRIINDFTAKYVIQNNSAHKSNISYSANLTFNVNDIWNISQELSSGMALNIGGNPGFSGFFENSKFSADISADIFAITNLKNDSTKNDAIAYQFDIAPKYKLSYGIGTYSVGFKINTHSDFDYTDNKIFSAVSFYPCVDVNFQLIPNILHIAAGVNLNVNQNSQKILSVFNPVVLDFEQSIGHFVYRPAITKNHYLLLSAAIFKDLRFSVKGSFIQYKNLVSYSEDSNHWTLPVYTSTNSAQVTADLKYRWKDNLSIDLTGILNYYDEKVPYMPMLEGYLDIRYNWKEKIVAKTQLYVYSNMYSSSAFDERNISGAFDWSIELEYRITRQWAVFVRGNNLLNTRYYRWDGRPSYKFNFLIGAAFNM